MLFLDYKPADVPLISQSMLDGEEDVKLCANPDDFLHLFVNTPAKMIDFIEYMIGARPNDSEGIYNTLLEHYMRRIKESGEHEAGSRVLEERVMKVLKSEDAKYDEDLALVHCHLYGFRKGLLFILEEKGHYSQILHHHVEAGDLTAVIATCRSFGAQNPNLWVEALQAVAHEAEATIAQVEEILEMVDKYKLLS